MQKDILFLGSQSQARQRLLQGARIPFKVLEHTSDEALDHTKTSFHNHVLAVADSKMKALVLPDIDSVDTDYIFVLTADTLIRNPRTGEILGKPRNRQHAYQMLAGEREGFVEVVTGCCLKKFIRSQLSWQEDVSEQWICHTQAEFFVDEDSVDFYLDSAPIALVCAGAGVIEDVGLSFLKSINGSYSGAIGLPLYELRQALKKHNFKF